ncbi:Sas10/Utp3/C1D family protein [Sporobolomyces koalae]|uniref:Sas10/Utp3/C1D family protein n=1 Tax=Sporobolomyces koalae TaxID=500713 RepID=UPI00318097CC
MADPALLQTLSNLSSEIGSLETALEPLLQTPFADLVAQHQDDPLAKAKLNVLVSYAVHDLIWVYLKTSGVDPTNHPVMQEIERLKGYFVKLKSAESGQEPPAPTPTPAQVHRRMQIDKQAASRFINHAIASQKSKVDPNYTPTAEDAEMDIGGTHTRFDAEGPEEEEENEEVERLLDDHDEDEEEVVPGAVSDNAVDKVNPKGKRKSLDPFAGKSNLCVLPATGYDQPKPAASSEKRKKSKAVNESVTTSGASTPLRSASNDSATEVPSANSKKNKKKKDSKKLKLKK